MSASATFLIFISSEIRQHDYPRIDGFVCTRDFSQFTFQGKDLGERYVYLGRELDIDEFNAAAARIYAPGFLGEDRTFMPLAIDPEASAKLEESRADAQKLADEATKAAAELELAEIKRRQDEETAAAKFEQERAEREEAERLASQESRRRVAAATDARDRENAAKAKAGAATADPVLVPTSKPVPAPRAKVATTVNKVEKKPETPVETPVETAPKVETAPTSPPDAPQFTLKETSIMMGDIRIGGLFAPDNQLRMVAKYKDEFKAKVEAWLKTLPA